MNLKPKTIAWGLGGLVVLGLALTRSDASAAKPEPPEPAPPGPNPLPPPVDPMLTLNGLIQRLQTQGLGAVDPASLDDVAVQLDAAGNPTAAATARAWAQSVRAAQGGLPTPPIPTGFPPPGTTPPSPPITVPIDSLSRLLVRYESILKSTQPATSARIVAIEDLANKLDAFGRGSEASRLRFIASTLRRSQFHR